jgi:hypothetical protein
VIANLWMKFLRMCQLHWQVWVNVENYSFCRVWL